MSNKQPKENLIEKLNKRLAENMTIGDGVWLMVSIYLSLLFILGFTL